MPTAYVEIWKPGHGPGLPVMTLESGDMRCRVAPRLGFNCLSWEVHTPDGWYDLLWTAPDVDTNPVPTRSGIPLLFPFPNRINKGRFIWEGKAYQLPLNSQDTHAIHGFVCYRPWLAAQFVKSTVSDSPSLVPSAIQARFDSRDHPDLKGLWPSDYLCSAQYSLEKHGELQFRFNVENVGESNLPMGLGLHPYFRINANTAWLAFSSFPGHIEWRAWKLAAFIPTGQLLPLTSGEQDDLEGRFLGNCHLDNVYQMDVPDEPDATVTGRLSDPSGMTVLSRFRREFRTVVLFTPHHRKAVCIEPYTCTTDAINLFSQGFEDAGLLILKPGQAWSTTFEWKATSLPLDH